MNIVRLLHGIHFQAYAYSVTHCFRTSPELSGQFGPNVLGPKSPRLPPVKTMNTCSAWGPLFWLDTSQFTGGLPSDGVGLRRVCYDFVTQQRPSLAPYHAAHHNLPPFPIDSSLMASFVAIESVVERHTDHGPLDTRALDIQGMDRRRIAANTIPFTPKLYHSLRDLWRRPAILWKCCQYSWCQKVCCLAVLWKAVWFLK